MAFSGSKDFIVTRDDIIKGALRKIGVLDSADAIGAAELSDAALSLNAIVKEWSGEGLALWLRQRNLLFLQPNQQLYTLGPSGDQWTDQRNLFRNTLSADETTGMTVISVADATWKGFQDILTAKPTTGVAAIRLDNGSMHFTAVTSFVGANIITITTALPSNASTGRNIYVYPAIGATTISRPVRLTYAYLQDVYGNASELNMLGRTEYEQLSRKNASGDPVSVFFDPRLTNAAISVWPCVPSRINDYIVLVTEHYSDDLDSASNNPQFPAEWANALIWNLALEMSFEYGVDPTTRAQVRNIANEKKITLFDTADLENASVILTIGE